MTEFKPGQIVEAVWPDGSMMRGKVRAGGMDNSLHITTGTYRFYFDQPPLAVATLTVVREPIPDEPTGSRALWENSAGDLWVRRPRADDDTLPWCEVTQVVMMQRGHWTDIAADGGRIVWAGEQP